MIYLAYDRKNDRSVAIKEFYPDGVAVRSGDNITVEPMTSQQEEGFSNGKKRFRNEAEIISRFRECSEMIGIYDVFEENGSSYYAMDFVHGASLKAMTKQETITPSQAVYIASKLLTSLEIMHPEQIVHRDVSPDNIMLCLNGSVKLIDFGSARHLNDSTQSMSVILKQGFAPLEQYQRRGNQGGWTDIYSLGASLFFGLTGKEPDDPLTGPEDDSLFTRALGSIPEPLGNILSKACSLRPDDRYRDAGEMPNAINKCGIAPESFPESRIQSALFRREETVNRPLPQKPILSGISGEISFAAASMARIWTKPVEVRIGGKMFPTSITELETVCFAGCGLTDPEPLRGCNKLRNIYFGRNNISDLSPLIGCDIAEMYIDGNQLHGNTEAFGGLTAHGFIVINNNGYRDDQIDYISSTINGEVTLYN